MITPENARLSKVDTSPGGRRVVNMFDKLVDMRGLPEVITVDNGPEVAKRTLDEWAYRRCVKLNFIRPGKPIENTYAGSFNGRFWDESMNTNWFITLSHARSVF
jgi:putative transposase